MKGQIARVVFEVDIMNYRKSRNLAANRQVTVGETNRSGFHFLKPGQGPFIPQIPEDRMAGLGPATIGVTLGEKDKLRIEGTIEDEQELMFGMVVCDAPEGFQAEIPMPSSFPFATSGR